MLNSLLSPDVQGILALASIVLGVTLAGVFGVIGTKVLLKDSTEKGCEL